jgi:phenylpyruvate tautomerase PptA (4-oxalocrotonate tautomerase family)
MPYLKLNTNVVVADEAKPELLSDLSQLLVKETGKPERYVMIELNSNQAMAMLFAGSDQPLAYLECKSIGLSRAQAQALSASLCAVLKQRLNIAADRVYIEFSNCPAEFWGWNGSTFG